MTNTYQEFLTRIRTTNTTTEQDENIMNGFIKAANIPARCTCGLVYINGEHGGPLSIQQFADAIIKISG